MGQSLTAHLIFGYSIQMKMPFLITTILILISLFATPAQAVRLQILHTNDTHSYLDSATHNKNVGGAARLKALIDFYKKQATDIGLKTIVVDSGDFLEGNIYYMAGDGKRSFDVHNEMGYDMGTLGNHDYQMGSEELNKILGEMDLKFDLLVANIKAEKQYDNIRNKIKPYKEIELEGLKIAFLGLTTDEILYKWRLTTGAISKPIETAQEYEKKLKNRGNDFIIALTHIGVLHDVKLAEKTRYIDLIVGGHSHTSLFQPVYGINKDKGRVPIVQAGMHTEFLGKLVVDMQKGKELRVVSYELVPVNISSAQADPVITEMVKQADTELDASYGKEWLEEKIAYSDLKPKDEQGARKWAYFITDTLREKTGADIAIHAPEMNGSNYPVGDITRRSIVNSIPRVFEMSQKYGWDIYTTRIKGAWLRLTIDALSYVGQPLTFSGLKMEYERGPLGFKIRHVTINGQKINPFKTYTVAFTEGIIRGAAGIDPRTIAILRNPKNTGFKIWATLEEKLKNLKEPISAICEDGHTTMWPDR
jgi:2',3'-cyclic-nucleotide 2'-phosphodiesterase (5'-nucleotidase family)